MERLRRFWLTGTCNPKKEEKKASEPLAPEQFISAFLLLMCGILVSPKAIHFELVKNKHFIGVSPVKLSHFSAHNRTNGIGACIHKVGSNIGRKTGQSRMLCTDQLSK